MGTVSVSPVFWSSSIVVFIGAILVILLAFAIYVALTARTRARRGMTELEEERDKAVTQLKEAEEIGKVGSFLWDYEEPAHSYWSNEMYELFGLVPRRKMPPIDSLLPYIHEGDRARFQNTWQRACTQPGNFSFTVRTVSNRGQVRNLNIEGRTVIREHETGSVRGVAHDITREMEIDRAKSEFVSLASHQLKTPLTSIKWLSEMLVAENAEPLTEKQLEYVRNIKASSSQMFEMVNDLLSMSRIELGTLAMTLSDFDIDALVRDVVSEQAHTAAQHSITVKLASDSSFPKMHADQKLVRMILQNLLSNAIKYSPDGSTVEYSLSLVSTPKDTIYIEVKDYGIGIPEKEQNKVFEKLYRAENAQKLVPDGTGLGLYVIKTILARAGGAITFESKEGKGTTFYVSIPVLWNVGEKPA